MKALYISLLIFLLPINMFAQWEWQSSLLMNKLFKKFLETKIISLIYFILILTCCEINCQTGKAKSLEIGNMWIYNVTEYFGEEYYQYYNVISDTTINNTNYAVIFITRSGGGIPQYVFERADSVKLFRYIHQNEIEITLIDFSLNVGDSLDGSVVTGKSYVTILGESFIKMSIYFDFPGLYWYDKSYIEKLGLVWEESDGMALNGYTYDLEAALIEGKIYGDTILLNIKKPDQLAPSKFIVYQNYPNPFNPTTSLQYSVGSRQFVTLKVYDLLGREIATLINEEKPAGVYEVEFNAVNLPSGIYFYQLRAGNPSAGSGQSFVDTKKMVLLR